MIELALFIGVVIGGTVGYLSAILLIQNDTREPSDTVNTLEELKEEIKEYVDGGEGSQGFDLGVSTARDQILTMIDETISSLNRRK